MTPAVAPSPLSAAPPPLPPGWPIAPGYAVLSHLSRGEDLDVYEVWSAERGCSCVAKAVRPDRADRERTRERLLGEGRLLLRLAHPHLVRAYEVFEAPPPVVILETLDGETLAHLVRRRRRLRPGEVARLGEHLCSAVRYLHHHGRLHADLKPSNVISEAGRAKVIDLSLARAPGPAPAGIGTDRYRAPEQEAGGELTPATDVWGIGAVLHAAATGRPPVAGVPVRRHRRRLPAALAAIVDACLDPAPDARPAVAEALAALDAV